MMFSILPSDVVLQSPAGKMLTHVMNAMLVLPLPLVMPVLHQILTLLPQMDRLCKLLPGAALLEESELEFKRGIGGFKNKAFFDIIF